MSKIYHIPLKTFVEFGGSPLAVQLVEMGVPVVVGMAGEVSTRHAGFSRAGALLEFAISGRPSVPTPVAITIGKIGNNGIGATLSLGLRTQRIKL
jgi:hypothetical protein